MKKSTLPVSGKFYSDISARISSSLSSYPRSAEEAMRIFHDYLKGLSPLSSDPMALLAFNMVRTEIDRALERSKRARLRAMARRKKQSDTNSLSTNNLSSSSEKVTETPAILPLSRRERRAAERLNNRSRKKWRPLNQPRQKPFLSHSDISNSPSHQSNPL